tara:strand:+ start:859 stop:1095 length:237 start_codon:yes stop_codon:yes gene_type:complete
MTKLQTATHISVLLASLMLIIHLNLSNINQRQLSTECTIAKDMASMNLRLAYDNTLNDNRLIERAAGYSAYYDAFCTL